VGTGRGQRFVQGREGLFYMVLHVVVLLLCMMAKEQGQQGYVLKRWSGRIRKT